MRSTDDKTSSATPIATSDSAEAPELARALGQASGEQVRRRGRGDERAHQVRAAPLVLLGRVDGVAALLVRADRLVLGAVVAGELA